jgi:uncharacterized membrane protein YbhN (UPF0104 family)
MTAILTVREQVALFLFTVLLLAIAILWAGDVLLEKYDEFKSRERVWREIEIRSSRERHPSFRASLYDWEKEVN